jgi:hypothetical protein
VTVTNPVTINSADITTDKISVALNSALSGQLTVALIGASASATVFQANASSGTANYSFNLSSLPAQEFTSVKATWTLNGIAYSASFAYHIRVNGLTSLTQYNTPHENTCSGNLQADTVYNNSCVVTNTSLISGFIFRVTNLSGGTGSGVSNHYGSVYQESYCSGHSSTSLRSFQTITGTLGPLGSTTLATCRTGPDAIAGAQIYIQGVGVKTVTDYCKACCGAAHYDNYSTSGQCSGLGSLPSAITVRIY